MAEEQSTGTLFAGMFGPISLAAGSPYLNPLPSETVTILNSDGSTDATLYTDRTKATGGSNPFTTNAYGIVQFWAAPGYYVASFSVGGTPQTMICEARPDYADSVWNCYTIVATPTAVASGDSVDCDATGGNIIIPALSGALGARYRFSRKDATTNTLTITAPAGGLIVGPGLGSGVSTLQLPFQGNDIETQSDGADARVVGGDFWWKAGTLLERVSYDPASRVTYTLSGGMAAVDATDISVSFTVPPSGAVMCRWSALASVTGGSAEGSLQGRLWDVNATAVVSGSSEEQLLVNTASSGIVAARVVYECLVTGLTAGTSEKWTPAAYAVDNTVDLFAGGGSGATQAGAFLFSVSAA